MANDDATQRTSTGRRSTKVMRKNFPFSFLENPLSALIPAVPYAKEEKVDCHGVAILAENLACSAQPGFPLAFQNVNFSIPCGCRAALIGPNGSGKSTLLRTLAGLNPLAEGTVKLLGVEPRLGRSRIAYLAQRPQLTPFFPLQLKRCVQMGTYAHHGWFEECHHGEADIEKALQLLDLKSLADRPIHQLSGGQLQRALLARATVQGAEILLLDEPFSALDSRSREIVESFLFHSQNTFTVLMATHDPAELKRFDCVLELSHGTLKTLHACRGHPHHHD